MATEAHKRPVRPGPCGRPCRPWQPKALSAWLVAQGRDWLRGLGGLQLGVLHTTGAAALVAGPCATRARQHDPFFFNAGARRRGSGEVGGGGANPPWGFSKFPAHGGSSRARSDRWPIPHRGGQTWQGAETPLVAGGSAGMGQWHFPIRSQSRRIGCLRRPGA
jgi:hypothetical protein